MKEKKKNELRTKSKKKKNVIPKTANLVPLNWVAPPKRIWLNPAALSGGAPMQKEEVTQTKT
jgi:hypothetical protein